MGVASPLAAALTHRPVAVASAQRRLLWWKAEGQGRHSPQSTHLIPFFPIIMSNQPPPRFFCETNLEGFGGPWKLGVLQAAWNFQIHISR